MENVLLMNVSIFRFYAGTSAVGAFLFGDIQLSLSLVNCGGRNRRRTWRSRFFHICGRYNGTPRPRICRDQIFPLHSRYNGLARLRVYRSQQNLFRMLLVRKFPPHTQHLRLLLRNCLVRLQQAGRFCKKSQHKTAYNSQEPAWDSFFLVSIVTIGTSD